MKLLFLNGSPRKDGYTATIMKLLRRNINPIHIIEWVDVYDLDLKPCIGCLKCRPNKECVLKTDDGHRIADSIRNSDAIVIGSPTYFGNISGPLRTLTDRCLTSLEEIAASGLEAPQPLHTGKKSALITACNMPFPMSVSHNNHATSAMNAMEIMLNAGGYSIIGKIVFDGAAARQVIPKEIEAEAIKIAKELSD